MATRWLNAAGAKEILVKNCFSAYKLGLQEAVTGFLQEENEAMKIIDIN